MIKNSLRVLSFLIFITPLWAQNSGHRMGGDIYKPENTLHCYQRALANLQDDAKFKYVELDIQETKDGKIVVFHDTKNIKRIVPKNKHNLKALARTLKTKKFSSIGIRDLNLADIKNLILENDATIPTLREVLDASIAWKLHKPMLIEIKAIHSDKCRDDLIKLVASYRKKIKVSFLAFPKAFKSSFPDPYRWKYTLKQHGFKVYTATMPKNDSFDLAKNPPTSRRKLQFATCSDVREFAITRESQRSIRMPISTPKLRGRQFKIRVGIEHGYDDSGDRGVRFRLVDTHDKTILEGFSNSRGWRWFTAAIDPDRQYTLILEDKDTKMKGKHGGNRGKINVSVCYLKP